MSLVSFLPAMEQVNLHVPGLLESDSLNCLLEALGWCPRLRQLSLGLVAREEDGELFRPFPDAPAFAKLRSLRSLTLSFSLVDLNVLAGMADALVPLTGLQVLTIGLHQAASLPAALGQLKGLRAMTIVGLEFSSIEAIEVASRQVASIGLT